MNLNEFKLAGPDQIHLKIRSELAEEISEPRTINFQSSGRQARFLRTGEGLTY